MNPPDFTYPRGYDLPDDKMQQSSWYVPREDAAYLYSLRPERTTIARTIQILVHKTIEQLKRAGFAGYDPEHYERAINNATITLGDASTLGGDRSLDGVHGSPKHDGGTQASSGDVRPGTGRVEHKDSGHHDQPSKVGVVPQKRAKNQKGTKGA